MTWANPVGFHTTLTDEAMERILSNVPKVLTVNLTAKLSKIHKDNLKRWMERGSNDLLEGNETIFAQLYVRFEEIRSECIHEMLMCVRAGKKGWKGTWEIVKSVAREDFGTDATEYKDLLDMVIELKKQFELSKDFSLRLDKKEVGGSQTS